MAEKKEKKEKSFLFTYAIIIIVILIAIVFLVPDSVFLWKYKDIQIPEPEPTEEFTDYEEQKEHLLKNKYDYSYKLLVNDKYYTCSGKVNEELESGSCEEPSKFSYTEANKKKLFGFDIKYLDFQNINELIKDVEPEEAKYQTYREYNYKITRGKYETEIKITVSKKDIPKIEIYNAAIQDIIEYSNVTY